VFQRTLLHLSSEAEDGGSMVLQNVGILPHHYMVSHFTLKLEAVWSFEMFLSCNITAWCCIPEDHSLND